MRLLGSEVLLPSSPQGGPGVDEGISLAGVFGQTTKGEATP